MPTPAIDGREGNASAPEAYNDAMFSPLVQPPAEPLDLDATEAWGLPRTVGQMVGAGRARDAVLGGAFRPADVDRAELGEVEAIWVPLWRVEGSVDSFAIGLTETVRTIRSGPDAGVLGGGGRRPPRSPRKRVRTKRSVLPTGGYSHHDGVVPVLARRGFAIDPSRKVKLRRADLVKVDELGLDPASTVLPDLPREEAEEVAKRHLRRRGQPGGNTLFAKVDTKIADARLCYYPLYVLRYRYGGEAVDGGPRTFFVAVSGTTGKVVASEHPSAWRSVGSKLRRLFGGE